MFADLVLKSSAVFTALGDRSQPGAVAIAGTASRMWAPLTRSWAGAARGPR